jgi:DNA polymerase III alpha subunit
MPSTAAVASAQSPPPDDAVQAAWRMLEAADSRCLSQVESPGFQALLRRVREASREAQAPLPGPAINSLEDLAQLLALWRPGAFSKTEEQAYLAARFGGQRPTYFHPALGAVLDPTHGVLLYAVMWTLARRPSLAVPNCSPYCRRSDFVPLYPRSIEG